MNKYWFIGLTSWSIGIALLSVAWQAQQDESVIRAERQSAHNQGYQEGYDRGYQEGWQAGQEAEIILRGGLLK